MLIFSHHLYSSFKRSESWGKRIAAGFTFIELLVVFAIIAILAMIVLADVNAAAVKTRDARRLQDIDALQAAIEVYFRDNGHYPIYTSLTGFDPSSSNYDATLGAALTSYYAVPLDPLGAVGGGTKGYEYISNASGSDYKILALGTPENMADFNVKIADPVRCGTVSGSSCSSGTNAIGFWTGGASSL